jgi:putative FmdB family regulatory protein
MPIYEYRCLDCGNISEIFHHSIDSQNIQCPACGSCRLDKLLSTPYTLRSHASIPGTTCCGKGERCQTPPCYSDDACRRDNK